MGDQHQKPGFVVGDAVRVDGDRHLYRVERVGDGVLDLEALSAHPRVTLTDLPSERAVKSEVYG